MRDIQLVLERWGAWAANDHSEIGYSHIAAGFKGLITQPCRARMSCSDDDALIIEACLARLKQQKNYEYLLLVTHYLYQVPKRRIAKAFKKDEKTIRIEIQMAERFIEGCLTISDVNLEMDSEFT